MVTSRLRCFQTTGALPRAIGATRRILALRFSTRASSSVRSRGVSPNRGGGPPVVSDRPGMAIKRLVPREVNSRMT